jgi:hypothetical protein
MSHFMLHLSMDKLHIYTKLAINVVSVIVTYKTDLW